MSLSELKGKSPSEARLYALEARLRFEENSRSKQITQLTGFINQLRLEFSSAISLTLPQVFSGKQYSQIPEKNSYPESLSALEVLQTIPDPKTYLNKTETLRIKNIRTQERKLSLDFPKKSKQVLRQFILDSSIS